MTPILSVPPPQVMFSQPSSILPFVNTSNSNIRIIVEEENYVFRSNVGSRCVGYHVSVESQKHRFYFLIFVAVF